MKRFSNLKKAVLAVLLIIFTASFIPAGAADYSFQVPELKFQVFIRPDSSVRLVYDITFITNQGARNIDIVDIGLPHKDYSLNNMAATIDGNRTGVIRPSTVVKPGVEVLLGKHVIRPGEQKTLHFECVMPDLIFQDTTREDYASLQITPTWFGKKYVTGRGEISIGVHMLPGIKPEEVLHHEFSPFTNKVLYRERIVAIWQYQGQASRAYTVGVSFPKRGLEQVVTIGYVERLAKKLEHKTDLRIIIGGIFILLFSLFFFRASGNTGWSLFLVLTAGLIVLFFKSPYSQIVAFPVLIGLYILKLLIFGWRGRRHYLPPIEQVKSGSVRRGLPAPMAAVIMEKPLGKVFLLIIFRLLKKEVLEITGHSPLKIRVTDPYRGPGFQSHSEAKRFMYKRARKQGVVIQSYEMPFIEAILENPGIPVKDLNFSEAMKKLIEQTVKKMRGADPRATRAYYQRRIELALQQAKSIPDMKTRWENLDKNLEWLLAGDEEECEEAFNFHGYYYQPPWIRFSTTKDREEEEEEKYRSSYYHYRWHHTFFEDATPEISPGALDLKSPSGGVIDLSGFDETTADVFDALMEGGSGSGGGFGGCACAGCACACACAGGGR